MLIQLKWHIHFTDGGTVLRTRLNEFQLALAFLRISPSETWKKVICWTKNIKQEIFHQIQSSSVTSEPFINYYILFQNYLVSASTISNGNLFREAILMMSKKPPNLHPKFIHNFLLRQH